MIVGIPIEVPVEALAKLDLMIKRKVSIVVKNTRVGHMNEIYLNDENMNTYFIL